MEVQSTIHQLSDVVSVTNFKGGVGKTTTVQTLAARLHKLHPQKRVIVIDLDPQCNLSFLLGWNDLRKTLPEYARMTIYDAMTKVAKIPVYTSPEGIYYVLRLVRDAEHRRFALWPKHPTPCACKVRNARVL